MADRIFIYKKFGTKLDDVAFEILNLETLNIDLNTPVSPMALPEESADENILVKMEGNSETISINWKLKDLTDTNIYKWTSANALVIGTNTTLTSDMKAATAGTGGSLIVGSPKPLTPLTTYQQIDFLREFVPSKINDAYIFAIFKNDILQIGREGTIGNISWGISGDSPIVWNVSINFFVGNVVSGFNSNVPEQPTIKTLVKDVLSGSSQPVTLTWVPFAYPSGVVAPTTTLINVRYKHEDSGMWTNIDNITTLTSPITITVDLADYTGTKTNAVISVRMALVSDAGVGIYSKTVTVT